MRALLALLGFLAACGAQPPAAPCPVCPPAAAAASQAPVTPARVEGAWHGVLGGQLHLALRIERQGDKLTGVLDSLDQGSKLPMEAITIDRDRVRFAIPVVSGSYEGTLEGDTMKGTWTQSGTSQPLAFERGEGDSRRPAKKPLDAPLDVTVAAQPLPLFADDHTVLVYELHIWNFPAAPVDLQSIDVTAAGRSLLRLEGADLAHALGHDRAHLNAGATGVVYLWVTLDGTAVPAALDHRIVVRVGDADFTVQDVRVAVGARAAPVLAAPLRGGPWKAANGPSNGGHHRRALIPVEGHARIAQRFAVDWAKLGPDGKSFSGDPAKNASYFAYGQQALAVADGVIAEVKDGIEDNVPQQEPAAPVDLENVAGNHVVVDIGGGRFALFAHFQHGSLKVKVGDRVKRGQVLGLVGNSGNSSEPHLHFHVSDAPSPLASEGVPYVFEAFELAGAKRTKQLPTQDEIVTFP